jgi:hypothetical protein
LTTPLKFFLAGAISLLLVGGWYYVAVWDTAAGKCERGDFGACLMAGAQQYERERPAREAKEKAERQAREESQRAAEEESQREQARRQAEEQVRQQQIAQTKQRVCAAINGVIDLPVGAYRGGNCASTSLSSIPGANPRGANRDCQHTGTLERPVSVAFNSDGTIWRLDLETTNSFFPGCFPESKTVPNDVAHN